LKFKPIAKSELMRSLPDPWPDDPLPQIREHLAGAQRKVVVLDDDPTGTQTIHDLPVLTQWPPDLLEKELSAPGPAFYLLTNSRSLSSESAYRLTQQIGCALDRAAERTGRKLTVVSRSDSTLRGHFPAEVDALADAMQSRFDACLLIPFFKEGGRYTIHDTHYLTQNERLLPVGLSEFAGDPDFGYRASNLKDWVAEKTGGRVPSSEVASISIDDLRIRGPEAVAEKLLQLQNGCYCVVNAAGYRDIEVFTLALLAAESRGKRFLYRSAASFVRVRSGISQRKLLTGSELKDSGSGGLVVVGSFVPTTTRQLKELLHRMAIHPIELDVGKVVDDAAGKTELDRALAATQKALSRGEDAVIFTSRETLTGSDSGSHLKIGQKISGGITTIVRGITVRPRFIVAKGGITSSVVATEGLGVKRAIVRGQILSGIPVWQLGAESRFPDLTYVVFPGNVGGPTALAEVLKKLKIP
jgi:uncharacterized protein YgbK (DUF1537 family)